MMPDVTRDGSGRWLPGAGSPNPAGRPGMPAEVKEILAEATPKAARKLVELMDDEDPRVALVACREVLDRSLGKPAQALEVAAREPDWGSFLPAFQSAVLENLRARHEDDDE